MTKGQMMHDCNHDNNEDVIGTSIIRCLDCKFWWFLR